MRYPILAPWNQSPNQPKKRLGRARAQPRRTDSMGTSVSSTLSFRAQPERQQRRSRGTCCRPAPPPLPRGERSGRAWLQPCRTSHQRRGL